MRRNLEKQWLGRCLVASWDTHARTPHLHLVSGHPKFRISHKQVIPRQSRSNCEPWSAQTIISNQGAGQSRGKERERAFVAMMLSLSQAVASQGATTSGFGSHRDEKFVGSRPVPLMMNSGLRQVSWRWQGRGEGGRLRAEVSKSTGNFPSKGLGVRCKVISVTEESFEAEVLKADLPVLVDFWASWCGPCKLVATSMDAVDRKYEGKLKVVKIDTEQAPKLVETYKVYGLPTLIMFRYGEVISGGRYEGAISLAKLESMLKKVLPSLAAA